MNPVIYSALVQSKPYTLLVSLLAVLLIGIVDYGTGSDVVLSIFYLLPISFATWYAGHNCGAAISVLAATVSFAGDFILTGKIYSQAGFMYWNGVMRAGVYFILVLLLTRLKAALLQEKEMSRVKSDMLSLVGHLNLSMTSNLDLHGIGKSLLETIKVFFPGCATTIRLLDPKSGNLEPLVSANLDEAEWRSEALHWPVNPEVVEMKAPRIVRDVQAEPQFWNSEFCRKNGLVSYLGYPLVTGGDLLGLISLYTKVEHDFTDEEISFFTTLAGQAAIALQNARLFEEVRTGHGRLRELSRRLLDVQETDRRHIAGELHDEIGQLLTGLKLTLEMNGRSPLHEASANLDRAQALIDELIRRVRGLSLDLRPSMLDDLGLLPALLWQFDRYTSTTGVDVHFQHRGLAGKRFDPRVETASYRIVQEALTNVARHAHVTQVAVHVWCAPDSVILEIRDDGVGFDSEAAIRAGNSIGLPGLRERTLLLGGEFNIDSTLGSGTCIIAELPLNDGSEKVTRQ